MAVYAAISRLFLQWYWRDSRPCDGCIARSLPSAPNPPEHVHHTKGRAGLLLGAVLVMFLFGLMMRGEFLKPQAGDLLTIVMYYGGFVCNVLTGVPYMIAVWFGYAQPDMAGAVHDYGTKFLVTAGLLNVLAMVDAYEIAIGKKS